MGLTEKILEFHKALGQSGMDAEVDAAMRQTVEIYSAFIRKRFVIQSRGGGEWPPIKEGTIVGRAKSTIVRVRENIDSGLLSGQGATKAMNRAIGRVEHLKDVLRPERATMRMQLKVRGLLQKAKGQNLSKTAKDKLWQRSLKIIASGEAKSNKLRAEQKKFKVAILIDTGTLQRALMIGSPGNYVARIAGGIRFGIYQGYHPGATKETIGQIAERHQEGGPRLPKRVIIVQPDDGTRKQIRGIWAKAFKEFLKARRGK